MDGLLCFSFFCLFYFVCRIDISYGNDEVQRAIKEKKECFKRLHLDKSAANIEGYKLAKRVAKRVVSVAKGKAYDDLYQRLGTKEE